MRIKKTPFGRCRRGQRLLVEVIPPPVAVVGLTRPSRSAAPDRAQLAFSEACGVVYGASRRNFQAGEVFADQLIALIDFEPHCHGCVVRACIQKQRDGQVLAVRERKYLIRLFLAAQPSAPPFSLPEHVFGHKPLASREGNDNHRISSRVADCEAGPEEVISVVRDLDLGSSRQRSAATARTNEQ